MQIIVVNFIFFNVWERSPNILDKILNFFYLKLFFLLFWYIYIKNNFFKKNIVTISKPTFVFH